MLQPPHMVILSKISQYLIFEHNENHTKEMMTKCIHTQKVPEAISHEAPPHTHWNAPQEMDSSIECQWRQAAAGTASRTEDGTAAPAKEAQQLLVN